MISMADTTVILNGHVVQGFSEDSDALTMPDAFELASVRRGATGDMAAFSTGDKGGPVSIKLLPNSRSLQFFMQQATLQLQGAVIIWDGSIQNTQTKFGFALARGVLTAFPLGQTMGKGEMANQVFTFEFESILPNYDAFRVPVPAIPAP